MTDPVDDNIHYRWNVFYFNKEDNRMLVPKRARWFGYTFNFAQPGTYIIIAFLLFCLFKLAPTA
jgi:uncharacterized membrane protein